MDHVQTIKRKIIERYSSLSDDKEKFARAMKGFVSKCVSSMEKKDDEDKY